MRRAILISTVVIGVVLLVLFARRHGDEGRPPTPSGESAVEPVRAVQDEGEVPGAPSGPCSLGGSVRWESGEPFRGRVRIGSRHLALDEAGKFRATGLPEGLLRVRAVSEDLESPPRAVWLPEESTLEIVVDRGWSTITGSVIDAATGEPVAGSTLSAWDCNFERLDTPIRGRADLNGAFRLRLPDRHGRLAVRAEGYTPREFPIQGRQEPFVVRLLKAGTVTGLVRTPNGEIVTGIRVYATSEDGLLRDPPSAVSDAHGRFSLGGLPANQVLRVFARGGGYSSPLTLPFQRISDVGTLLTLRPGQTASADLVVVPAARVDGRVLDADGAGVPQVEVGVFQVRPRDLEGFLLGPSPTVRADDDGSFHFDSLRPGMQYHFGADRGETAFRGTCDPVAAGQSGAVELRPEPPGKTGVDGEAEEPGETIDGFVRMPDGRTPRRTLVSAKPLFECDQSSRTWRNIPCGPTGFFRVSRLPPGEYELIAKSYERGTFRPWIGKVRVPAGARAVTIELSEPSPRDTGELDREPVTVRILDPVGIPIDSGQATLIAQGPKWTRSDPLELTGKDLTRSLIPDDTKFLEVYGVRDRAGRRLGDAFFGPYPPETSVIEVRLALAHPIRGRITDSSGRGVPQARVKAVPKRPYDDTFSGKAGIQDFSAGDGSFVLDGAGDYPYRLSVETPRGYLDPPSLRTHGGGRDIVISLRRGMDAVVKCVDARGHPVSGVAVTVSGSVGRVDTTTGADGRAVLPDLDPQKTGRLRLRPPDLREDLIAHTPELSDWKPGDQTFEFGTAWTPAGRVVDPSGRPVPEVTILWRSAGGDWRHLAEADHLGNFVGERIPAAPFEVLVTTDWEPSMSDEPLARVEDDRPLTLVFDPGPGILVHVENWPKGVEAEVKLFPLASDYSRTGRCTREGVIRFIDVDRDQRYALFGICEGRVLHLTGLRPSKEEITARLEPGFTVSGTVFLDELQKNDWIHVTLSGPGLRQTRYCSYKDEFAFHPIPHGSWTLSVRYCQGEKWHTVTRGVTAGDHVDLVLGK